MKLILTNTLGLIKTTSASLFSWTISPALLRMFYGPSKKSLHKRIWNMKWCEMELLTDTKIPYNLKFFLDGIFLYLL